LKITPTFIGTIASRRLKGQNPLGSSQVLALEEISIQPLFFFLRLILLPKKKNQWWFENVMSNVKKFATI
jgi:hypothetical protein